MKLATIGFTGKPAERFFTLLSQASVRRVIDVRLNNRSQLAGFSKRDDLAYFLGAIGSIEYRHELLLAPTPEMLSGYMKSKKKPDDWAAYEQAFLALIRGREIEKRLDAGLFDGGCLLCSEHRPQHCHRRVVTDYLRERWGADVEVTHLV